MSCVIDLFSGCGGFSQGFFEAGFEIDYGFDIEKIFLETFSNNIKCKDIICEDLSKIENFSKYGKTDVIVAGPPCQGFSLTGPRKINDPRNKLYLSAINFISKNQPKAFIIENVRGLYTMWNGQVFKEILKELSKLDYEITYKIVDTATYGVPQHRIRVFIVGTKKKYGKFKFPKEDFDKKNFISCKDAIDDLPSLEKNLGQEELEYNFAKPKNNFLKYVVNSKYLYNHVGTKHKDFVIDTIKLVPDGGNYKDLPKGIGESRKFNEAWTRYASNKPSRTIDTGHRNHFHYKYNRVPTVRENARLQSFKDSFRFLGSKTKQNFQVGNAVPPLVAFKIAKQLNKLING